MANHAYIMKLPLKIPKVQDLVSFLHGKHVEALGVGGVPASRGQERQHSSPTLCPVHLFHLAVSELHPLRSTDKHKCFPEF